MAIYFGSQTASDDKLDDYEEGTYTVTVQTDNGVNCGLSDAQGSYVKVGNICIATITIQTNSHSGVNTTGRYRVFLPFTAKNQSGIGTEGNLTCSIFSISSQSIGWMAGEISNNFNFIYMSYHNNNNNNTNNLTPSAANNSLFFRGTAIFRTA
tara:strand:- start:400 stop:858 length:459 start_codon:yes stop_codon:yes gene_type:complete